MRRPLKRITYHEALDDEPIIPNTPPTKIRKLDNQLVRHNGISPKYRITYLNDSDDEPGHNKTSTKTQKLNNEVARRPQGGRVIRTESDDEDQIESTAIVRYKKGKSAFTGHSSRSSTAVVIYSAKNGKSRELEKELADLGEYEEEPITASSSMQQRNRKSDHSGGARKSITWEEKTPKPTSPPKSISQTNQNRKVPEKPKIHAPGFSAAYGDGEDNLFDTAPHRRMNESKMDYDFRVAHERHMRESNRRNAEERADSDSMQELLGLVGDRILIYDDKALNGEKPDNYDEDNKPVDIAAAQAQQLKDAIARLNLKVKEERYRTTTENENGEQESAVVSKNLYTVKGMVTPLLDHQIIAVSWMVNDREKSGRLPRGGLLFDAMGLGKTMQCIATMCQNPPPEHYSSETDHKITLIVCPVALLQQWKREIETHTEKRKFRVHIHHGRHKIKTAREFRHHEVVITTYHTVVSDFPNIELPDELKDSPKAEAIEARLFRKNKGTLYRVKYWRIIFDESHVFRNQKTAMSEAVMTLAKSAKQSWCLSGTPIFNGLQDLYPAFNIIRMPELSNSIRFEKILENSSNPTKTIQISLRAAMIRRTKEDVFLGKPLMKLPPKEIREVSVKFDPDARVLYDALEDRARDEINSLSKRGKLKQSFSHIVVLLLRLRQLCNHPYLTSDELKGWNQFKLKKIISWCDANYAKHFGKKALFASTASSHYPVCKASLKALEEDVDMEEGPVDEAESSEIEEEEEGEECDAEKSEAEGSDTGDSGAEKSEAEDSEAKDCGPELDSEPEDIEMKSSKRKPKKHNTRPIRDFLVRLHDAAQSIEEEDEEEENPPPPKHQKRLQTCAECNDEVNGAVVTPCEHVFCRDCIEEAITIEERNDRDYECIVCEEVVGINDLEDTVAPEIDDPNHDPEVLDLQQIRDGIRKAQAKLDAEFKENVQKRFFMTKKLKVMIKQLHKWRVSKPGEKVVLFSQAVKFLDIIQKVTDQEGWVTTRYTGSMEISLREESLTKFKNDPDCWIMLTSTKAGGVGLNLTHASLVLSMDLWWNAAIELQAFDRVHRFGQVKDVEVVRYIMEKSVETRMLELQKTKLEIAGMALGEDGYKVGKLSHKELLGLFGAVRTDAAGRMTVGRD